MADNNMKLMDNFLSGIEKWKEREIESGANGRIVSEAVKRLYDAFTGNAEQLNLNGLELRSLPQEVRYIITLKDLSVSNNKLSSFPQDVLFLRGLERLDISANKISRIPREIVNLRNLKSLDVNSSQVDYIAPEIRNIRTLEDLQLRDNNINFFPRVIIDKSSKSLKNIDIKDNPLKDMEYSNNKTKGSCSLDDNSNYFYSAKGVCEAAAKKGIRVEYGSSEIQISLTGINGIGANQGGKSISTICENKIKDHPVTPPRNSAPEKSFWERVRNEGEEVDDSILPLAISSRPPSSVHQKGAVVDSLQNHAQENFSICPPGAPTKAKRSSGR